MALIWRIAATGKFRGRVMFCLIGSVVHIDALFVFRVWQATPGRGSESTRGSDHRVLEAPSVSGRHANIHFDLLVVFRFCFVFFRFPRFGVAVFSFCGEGGWRNRNSRNDIMQQTISLIASTG